MLSEHRANKEVRTKVVKDGCMGFPSAPIVVGLPPNKPAETAPAAAIAAEVTVDAFDVGGAAV